MEIRPIKDVVTAILLIIPDDKLLPEAREKIKSVIKLTVIPQAPECSCENYKQVQLILEDNLSCEPDKKWYQKFLKVWVGEVDYQEYL